jgi:hypothetical protein
MMPLLRFVAASTKTVLPCVSLAQSAATAAIQPSYATREQHETTQRRGHQFSKQKAVSSKTARGRMKKKPLRSGCAASASLSDVLTYLALL